MPSLEEYNQQPHLNKGLILQNDESRISKMVAPLVMLAPLACLTSHKYIPCADCFYVKTFSPVSCITDSMALCLGPQRGLQLWDEQAVLQSGTRRVRDLFSRPFSMLCKEKVARGWGSGKVFATQAGGLEFDFQQLYIPVSTQKPGWWHVLIIPVLGKGRWKESRTCWQVSLTKSASSKPNW